MNRPEFSVVIPVFNRPQEIHELLDSLVLQTWKNFEVIVVEDGSELRSDRVIDQFHGKLNVRYVYKPNTGPGPSRNAGFAIASGDFFVVFDSDCIVPATYFESVKRALGESPFDAWGGPDKAHENFSLLQRAMGYTMSSVLTTGGIRGGKRRMGWFQPRSFNMGISRAVFEATGGFRFDRAAEDIELSIRMRSMGFRVVLLRDAYVYHRRRTNLSQFFAQVFNFGRGRALVGRHYPSEVTLTHWVPTLFTTATLVMLLLPLFSMRLFMIAGAAFALYMTVLFFHSLATNRNFLVALLSVPCAIFQFFGYGIGFLRGRMAGKYSQAAL